MNAAKEFVCTTEDCMGNDIECWQGWVNGCRSETLHLADEDVTLLQLENGSIEMVDNFQCLGSCIDASRDMKKEILNRIAKAVRAFSSLRKSIFQDSTLSVSTKHAVYHAVVMSVLFYGAETWTLKAEHIRRLRTFHNQCIWIILGATRYQQWIQHLSSSRLAHEFCLQEPIEDILTSLARPPRMHGPWADT